MNIIRAIKKGDVEHVAGNMRWSDKVETWASTQLKPFDVLGKSVALSDQELLWAIEYDGEPVAVFGVASGTNGGIPWLLATDMFATNPAFVKKFPKAYINRMADKYGRLYNYVHNENRRSKRWLERCGFTVHGPTPFGFGGEPFCYFELEKGRGINHV